MAATRALFVAIGNPLSRRRQDGGRNFTHPEATSMSDALLDYSSWSFQLITFLAVLYLVFGVINPAWVMGHEAEHYRHRVGDCPAPRLDRLSTSPCVRSPGALDGPTAIERRAAAARQRSPKAALAKQKVLTMPPAACLKRENRGRLRARQNRPVLPPASQGETRMRGFFGVLVGLVSVRHRLGGARRRPRRDDDARRPELVA